MCNNITVLHCSMNVITFENLHLSHPYSVFITQLTSDASQPIEFCCATFKSAFKKASDMWLSHQSYKKCKKEFGLCGMWCEVWRNDNQVCSIEKKSSYIPNRFIFSPSSAPNTPRTQNAERSLCTSCIAYNIITRDSDQSDDILRILREGPISSTEGGILVRLLGLGIIVDPTIMGGWKKNTVEIMRAPPASSIILMKDVIYAEIFVRVV